AEEWVDAREDRPRPNRDEETDQRAERQHRAVLVAPSQDEDRDHGERRGCEEDAGSDLEPTWMRERIVDDAFLFGGAARDARVRPGKGPAGDAMGVEDPPLARVEERSATRGEDDESAEALLDVVPPDEEEHELDHAAEHRRRAKEERDDRPGR